MAGSTFQTNPIDLNKLLDDCHRGIIQATGKSAYTGGVAEEGEDVEGDEDSVEAELTIAAG